MKTNVEALKALYVKLGGSLTDTYSDIAGGIPVGEYELISDCILACAKKGGGGGGSDLPDPGSVGNVLTSTGSAWESAAPSDNDFIIETTLTIGESGETEFAASDVPFADLVTAIEGGRSARLIATNSDYGLTVMSDSCEAVGSTVGFSFVAHDPSNNISQFFVYASSNGSGIVFEVDSFPILPAVSGSDNGKVLGVSNGAYALVSNSATTIIDVVSDGQGGYTASVNGSPITLSQILTLAATKVDMKAICEIDNGRYISVPLISWDSSGAHFMGAAVVSDKPATAYAICEDEGSGEAWSVGIVQTT